MGNEYKICYYCGEKIQVYARRCDYCGSLLKPELNRLHNPAFSNELIISDESSSHFKEFDESNGSSSLDSDKIYESNENSNLDSEKIYESNENSSLDSDMIYESNESSNSDSDIIYESSEESKEKKINEFNVDKVNQHNLNNNKVERAENNTNLGVKFYPGTYVKNRLSNGLKVFITVISSVIPGLGQLIGVIISITFINSDDHDMRSFGTALLVSSMVLFVISCILFFIITLALLQYMAM